MYCGRCGAELAPDGCCRFAVPEEEAPWLAGGADPEGPNRDALLPVARWLLHHPEAAPGRLEWARRTAGVEGLPVSGGWPRSERGTNVTTFEVKAIGRVESPLTDPASAPRQPDEGAPAAWLVFEPEGLEGLRSLRPGDEVTVITWLDRARRDVLSVHPRGDASRPQEGVFSTRSPHRPNPIGLHRVEIAAIEGRRVRVRHLEAVDGTPILDVKPILSENIGER